MALSPAVSYGLEVECEAPEQVRDRINACSENTEATKSANECYRKILRAWSQAPAELKRVMSISKARKSSRQQAELAFSKTDYEKTMRKLRALLDATEYNTKLVALYPRAMLHDPDFPELNCYSDPFQEVQEIVYQLDDRIKEGEQTLAAAESLFGVSGTRERLVDTDSLNRKGGARTTYRKTGRQETESSDVTGLREEAGKSAKTSESLKQLDRKAQGEFREWEKPRFTKRSAVSETIEVFSRSGPAEHDFQAEVSRLPGSGPGEGDFSVSNNSTAQREAPSVGAFLFREGGAASPMKLELSVPERSGGEPRRDLASAGVLEVPESDAVASTFSEMQASDSLFSRVSNRYRKTDLFRSSSRSSHSASVIVH